MQGNSGEHDQTPSSVASDLDLHCLPMYHKKDARLIRVKCISVHEHVFANGAVPIDTVYVVPDQIWIKTVCISDQRHQMLQVKTYIQHLQSFSSQTTENPMAPRGREQ